MTFTMWSLQSRDTKIRELTKASENLSEDMPGMQSLKSITVSVNRKSNDIRADKSQESE